MESVTPPGSAERSAVRSNQAAVLLLQCCPLCGEDGMREFVAGDDFRRLDSAGVVERDAEGMRRLNVLEDIHVICDGCASIVSADAVVPCGPRSATARQNRLIRVQYHIIAAVRESAQDSNFIGCGLFEQCEGLIAVAGKHNLVERMLAGVGDHRNRSGSTANTSHRRVRDNAVRKRLDKAADVVAGSARNCVPLRSVRQAEKPVIAVELEDKLNREVSEGAHRTGPDGSSHGQQVVIPEALTEAAAAEVLTDGFCRTDGISVSGSKRIESENIQHHADKGGAEQARSLSKNTVQAGSAVFDASAITAHCKTHFRGNSGYPQQMQQFHEQGVGAVVVDNKADVDRVIASVEAELDGAAVPAGQPVRLKHGDGVLL